MQVQNQQRSLINILISRLKTSKKIEALKTIDINSIIELDEVQIQSIFYSIDDSWLQREFVSIIGRTRNAKFISFLLSLLNSKDPKILMQAIRGLVCFKDDTITLKLKGFLDHPNEMVSAYIRQVFSKEQNTKPTYKNCAIRNIVVMGDTIDIMKYVKDESIHLTFTSPPYYNARDYSTYQSYNEYLEFLSKVFKEIYRVTAEGRFFIINTSPIIVPRAGRQFSSKRYPIPFDIHRFIIEAGFEFIDDIIWAKPEASVKNRNGGFKQHRKPLAYKPNTIIEYVMVYRKKTDKLIDWNIKQYSCDIVDKSKVKNEYETTNLWKIDPTYNKVHPATFPTELCKRIISFYSYIGDIVFDPFAGSGTVGRVALDNERHCFLTEINQEYFKEIKKRLNGIFSNEMRYLSYEDFVDFCYENTR